MGPPPPRSILPILTGTSSFGILASTLYVPSIPSMARDLSVSVNQVQLTITVYIVAFGAGNLIVGPLSDRYGRRPVLIGGALLCAAASAAASFADTVIFLLLARIFQAFGACTGNTVSRAVIRDLYSATSTAKVLSGILMIATLLPLISLILGGYIDIWLGWRASFLLVGAIIGGLAIWLAVVLPETNKYLAPDTGFVSGIFGGFGTLLRSRRFYGYALGITSFGSSFYAFVSAGPIIMIELYGQSPTTFGYSAITQCAGLLIGTFCANRLAARMTSARLIFVGGFLLLAAGVLQISLVPFEKPWAIFTPLFLMGMSSGVLMPTVYAASVSLFPHLAGAASGLTNTVQNLSAAITTAAIAAVEIRSSLPLGLTYVIGSLAVIVGAWLSQPQKIENVL